MVEQLVSSGRLTAVALETGLPESAELASFVAGGPDAPPAEEAARIVARAMTWGFGSFAENVDLVRWLRDWNDDPKHLSKVRVYGIDLSLGGPTASTPTPAAVEHALTWLASVDANTAERLSVQLAPLLRHLPGNPAALDQPSRRVLGRELDALAGVISAAARRLPPGPNTDAMWAVRSAEVARQAHAMFVVDPPPASGGISPEAWRAMSARDSAMAENVRWVLDREGPNGRVLVYAHVMHVKRVPTEGRPWSVLVRPPRSMGEFLAETTQVPMTAIAILEGTDATKSYRDSGTTADDRPVSLDAVIGGFGTPPFALSLRAAGNGAMTCVPWARELTAMRVNGDSELRLVPCRAFDHLVTLGPFSGARTVSGK